MATKKSASQKQAAPTTPAKTPRRRNGAPPPVEAPAAKPAKVALVRDSFTIPAPEYEVIGELKGRAAALQRPAKKSELLRAGLKLLVAMKDEELLASLAAVPSIKTGRPKGKKTKADAPAAARKDQGAAPAAQA